MCLIAFAWRCSASYPLILVANRDEWHARPAAPLQVWSDGRIWAGRDLQAGGTWLGVTAGGRMAALTNVREAAAPRAARSRGLLVRDYLGASQPARAYAEAVLAEAEHYAGFNLLLRDGPHLHYVSNRYPPRWDLPAGVYGLSNAGLDSPWPKLEILRERLRQGLTQVEEAAWTWLTDRQQAEDAALPQTGIDPAWEKVLSAAFIVAPGYGTRSSAVLLQGEQTRFCEQRWDARGEAEGERTCLGMTI